MKNTLISLESVGVSFSVGRNFLSSSNSLEILKNISFEVKSGESIGVLGRNGAGKSTLLKLIAGIIAPDSGTISRKKNVSSALLNLQIGFDLELSGHDNIFLLGILLGCDKKTIASNVQKIVDFSELGNAILRPVKGYSAGMKARLGFAVAMELRTDILLIDEVLGVGDIEFREKSTAALRGKIQSDQTVVLVSHQAPVIKSLCDRAIWIENGVVQEIGPAVEVIEMYEKFVIGHPVVSR